MGPSTLHQTPPYFYYNPIHPCTAYASCCSRACGTGFSLRKLSSDGKCVCREHCSSRSTMPVKPGDSDHVPMLLRARRATLRACKHVYVAIRAGP